MKNLIKVQCIMETGYNDADLGEFIDKNKIYYVTEERAKLLKEKNVVKILSNIEIEKPEEKKEEKSRRRNRTMM